MKTPSRLYKFMQREHANGLVKAGNIRVGTLLDYKKSETYGAEVGDDQEGMHSTRVLGDRDSNAQIKEMTIEGALFKDIAIEGIQHGHSAVRYDRMSPQFYALCFSLDNEKTAMERMGYDTCVEIDNPWFFAHALNRQMALEGKINYTKINYDKFIMAPCHYMDKIVNIEANSASTINIVPNQVPIYLQKRLEHQYQKELRMLWVPNVSEPQPFITSCIELTNFCRIVEPR